jgi:CRP-like cAMP-binding protein
MDLEPPRIGTVERVLFLKRIPWLSGLDAHDLATLAEYARERPWSRGAVLLRAGEPVGAMHFVVDGRVKLRRRGRELGCATAGSAIGATLLLAEDAAGLDAVADGDTLTLALERESFLDVLEERFAIFRGVLRETARELVALFVRNPIEAAPAPVVRGEEPRLPIEGELDLVDRIVLLRSRRPFEAGSINALAELSQRLDDVRLPAGTVLWRRADRADRMMFVASGRVRCEPPEREAAFWMGPGQPLGTLELLGELPRWYDAVVEEAATVLEGEVEELLDVFEDNVDMGLVFLAYLTRSTVELQERIAEREGSLSTLFGCGGTGA